MAIHPNGLTLAARPWSERPGLAKLRAEPPSRVGWDDVDKVELDEGFFLLRLRGSAQPRLTVEAGEPNFYPGYLVVAETLRERAASRPVAPVRGLAHGEKITVEYPYSIPVRFGIERAAFLVNPKAQKNARETRLGMAVFLPACGVGLAVMAFFQGKFGSAALQWRLMLCVLFGIVAYAAIEVGGAPLHAAQGLPGGPACASPLRVGAGSRPGLRLPGHARPAGLLRPDAAGRGSASLELGLACALGPRLDHHL